MEFFAMELAEGTRNYTRSAILGKGGYGTVFKGFLRHCDVAVKILTKVHTILFKVRINFFLLKDGQAAFTKEISALGR